MSESLSPIPKRYAAPNGNKMMNCKSNTESVVTRKVDLPLVKTGIELENLKENQNESEGEGEICIKIKEVTQTNNPHHKNFPIFEIKDIFNFSTNKYEDNISLDTLKTNSAINIIIIDDEKLARASTARVIRDISLKLNLTVNFIELEDGAELVFTLYQCLKKGIRIDYIFSDETMNYINGLKSAQIVKDILMYKSLSSIPFYLVTAYGNLECFNYKYRKDLTDREIIKEIISKPANREQIEEILRKDT